MADESQTAPPPDPNTPPAGTPDNPMSVTIVGPGGPGASTAPAAGLDETVEGGAYRFQNLDESTTWKDAEGREIKAPRGKGR